MERSVQDIRKISQILYLAEAKELLSSCDEFLVGADGRSLGADALVVIPHYLSLIGAKDDLHLALLYASTSIPQQLAYPLRHLSTSQPPTLCSSTSNYQCRSCSHTSKLKGTVCHFGRKLAGYLLDNKFCSLPKRIQLAKSILQVTMKSGDNFAGYC